MSEPLMDEVIENTAGKYLTGALITRGQEQSV